MKAYFVADKYDQRGYAIHAETPGQAKMIVHKYYPGNPGEFEYTDWLANRLLELDDKPITIQNMIEARINMEFDGEPITDLDVRCPCSICMTECGEIEETIIESED